MSKGLRSIKENADGSMVFLRLKNGESKVIRIVLPEDQIPSVWEHTEKIGGQWKTLTCLGKLDCPLCKAGKKASNKAYIPVIDRADGKIKVFKASITVVTDLLGCVDEYGCLTNRDYKITRQGEELNTKYQFFSKDLKVEDFSGLELPDIEERIRPLTIEAMTSIISGSPSDEVSDTAKGVYPF
jgi:hypothetical protein